MVLISFFPFLIYKHTYTHTEWSMAQEKKRQERQRNLFFLSSSVSSRPLEGLFNPPLVIPLRDKCLHPASEGLPTHTHTQNPNSHTLSSIANTHWSCRAVWIGLHNLLYFVLYFITSLPLSVRHICHLLSFSSVSKSLRLLFSPRAHLVSILLSFISIAHCVSLSLPFASAFLSTFY